MGYSLKRLSRKKLRELLVALSADYDELCDENERMKEEMETRRFPRNAKVGSIAEAALQANGYFTAAQRSADEYLREIKRLRDELAYRVNEVQAYGADPDYSRRQSQAKAQAEAEAQAILRDAKQRANSLISRAQNEAEQIVHNAEGQVAENAARRRQEAYSQAMRDSGPRHAGGYNEEDSSYRSSRQGRHSAGSMAIPSHPLRRSPLDGSSVF